MPGSGKRGGIREPRVSESERQLTEFPRPMLKPVERGLTASTKSPGQFTPRSGAPMVIQPEPAGTVKTPEKTKAIPS
jgi:hypothetical protein